MALPVVLANWRRVVVPMLRGRPPGLVQQEVCAYSGLLPTPLCDSVNLEWFLDGAQPSLPDNVYRQIWLDSASGRPKGSTITLFSPGTALAMKHWLRRAAAGISALIFSSVNSVSRKKRSLHGLNHERKCGARRFIECAEEP